MEPQTYGEAAPDRTLWALTGPDALTFLQGLVSNDLRPLEAAPGIVWCALLTPQGKYLADFFVVHTPQGTLLIDIATSLATAILRRLTMYRLRANVHGCAPMFKSRQRPSTSSAALAPRPPAPLPTPVTRPLAGALGQQRQAPNPASTGMPSALPT